MDAFTQVTGATNGVVPVDVNAVAAKELRVEAGGLAVSSLRHFTRIRRFYRLDYLLSPEL